MFHAANRMFIFVRCVRSTLRPRALPTARRSFTLPVLGRGACISSCGRLRSRQLVGATVACGKACIGGGKSSHPREPGGIRLGRPARQRVNRGPSRRAPARLRDGRAAAAACPSSAASDSGQGWVRGASVTASAKRRADHQAERRGRAVRQAAQDREHSRPSRFWTHEYTFRAHTSVSLSFYATTRSRQP